MKLAESWLPCLSAAAGSWTVSFNSLPADACAVTARIPNVLAFGGFLPFLAFGTDVTFPVSFT